MSDMGLQHEYTLGIDLGAESVGWAALAQDASGPTALLACGAHTFEAGVEGDLASGRDEPRGAVRRAARLARRQHCRRSRRRRKLLRLLQRAGLMPAEPLTSPEAIDRCVKTLDAQLAAKHCAPGDKLTPHVLCYRLRKQALDRPLEAHELGRAIYHLAQRRGYQSNRRAQRKDEDTGVVESAIVQLRQEMDAAGARTLGEYFASLDPLKERIRRRWTARDMYTQEFDAIWAAQQPHHPVLTAELRDRIHEAIFFQRPLSSQAHLIGACDLVPGRKRAPMATLLAQRFRLLQRVNDLLIEPPAAPSRPLAADERSLLIAALERDGDLTFAEIRKRLRLKRGVQFNLERGGEKKLPGNRTNAKLRSLLGQWWDELAPDRRDLLVDEIRLFEKRDALERRLRTYWNITEQAIGPLSAVALEDGYAAHSLPALRRLVGRMEEGVAYMTARRELFPETFAPRPVARRLPPVVEALPALRNPAVRRALTELRKVVNAIVARYGRPTCIRIELARDLRNARQARKEIAERMRARQKERESASRRILSETGIENPSRDDVERVLLADECNWRCPFTDRQIEMRALVGRNPQFDIAHIIPRSLSLDDSFANKTLCYHEENRNRMRNKTPLQAYGGDPERWNAILDRVARFRGPHARRKLERFRTTDAELADLLANFTSRQLNDTRYASRLAADYLGALYGGRVDAGGSQRVFVSAGGVTAHIRNELGLNRILGDGGEKNRQDHRHHAVDAICVALADTAMVKRLADAADHAWEHGRRRFAPVAPPWESFLDDVRRQIDAVVVSRRPNHRVQGLLHAESLYSKPHIAPDGQSCRHIRKELFKLTPSDVRGDAIVDPAVRKLIQAKLAEVGGTPDKVFIDPRNHPCLTARNGDRVPIHKVRVRVDVKPWTIGKGPRQRHVTSKAGTNHHVVLVSRQGPKGEEWADHVVSRFEAHRRLSAGEPVIKREWPDGWQFRFWLCPDDYVEMDDGKGQRAVFRLQKLSAGDFVFRLHSDGRKDDEIQKAKQRVRATSSRFWAERKVRKVRVTHLGEVIPCND